MTVEGSTVLHQIFRFRWAEWRKLDASDRAAMVGEAQKAFAEAEGASSTALFTLLGHKGDLLLVHFRNSFEELSQAQLLWSQLRLSDYCDPVGSYVSIVELSLHDSSLKLYKQMAEQGVAPHSEPWNALVKETMDRQREAMRPRLFPSIPDTRYVCFYPMDRRRGEDKNWYTLPLAERQRQMDAHGTVGRRYAGKVQQIISGSIAFDDWEWAVDLFGNDAVVFKKLIYEMRFDEVSAVYSNFGTFYIGLRCPLASLGGLLEGRTPEHQPKELPRPAGRPGS
jgi:chlorite dismutase